MSCGVLIMAKAPRPGLVKTRLEPLLGRSGCVELQRELIRYTAGWVSSLAAPTWLAYAPEDAALELAELLPEGIRLFPQSSGDLGWRLRAATATVTGEHEGPLAVVGIDAPLLAPAHVDAASRTLVGGHDACLVPALDGGYSMIALARPDGRAFEIPARAWGGPEVLELTIGALRGANMTAVCLGPVGDLDTPADVTALLADPSCPPRIRDALRPRTTA